MSDYTRANPIFYERDKLSYDMTMVDYMRLSDGVPLSDYATGIKNSFNDSELFLYSLLHNTMHVEIHL